MGKTKPKSKKNNTFNGKKSRKTIRKEKRVEKKQRKQEYYVNRNKGGKFVLAPDNDEKNSNNKTLPGNNKNKISTGKSEPAVDSYTQEVLTDKKRQVKLEKEMRKRRKKQLQEQNLEEDKVIKRLEKDLKLNKRKTKSIPKSFETDGLDYLLEVCDPENIKNVVSSEKQFTEGNDDFEEDFALISGKTKKASKNTKRSNNLDSEEENDDSFFSKTSKKKNKSNKVKNDTSDDSSNEDTDDEPKMKKKKVDIEEEDSNSDDNEDNFSDISENEDENFEESSNSQYSDDLDFEESEDEKSNIKVQKNIEDTKKSKKDKNKKKVSIDTDELNSDPELEDSDEVSFNEEESGDEKSYVKAQKVKTQKNIEDTKKSKNGNNKKKVSIKNIDSDPELDDSNEASSNEEDSEESDKEETWEDIYGRKRTKDGEVLPTQTKYIPPALRNETDTKRSEKLMRLKKQLKGLLNRLAESNMHSISTQIEELYMNNSRNDMNETLTHLIFDSLVSCVHTPERLLLEHVMLIAILHANVGTEVGATFLLNIVKKFDELFQLDQEVENKELDNTVQIIAQLYNFKLFQAQLLYQIIAKLAERFQEKHVECILLVLKNVGFSLRKDDPVALKQIILDLQKRATTIPDDNSRVKFMLDILLAIKNNNVTKIPNYDTSYSEHLKKLIKGLIRKGNYVTQLNISLEDLLKADERGKWWVVGSAWTGMEDKKANKEEKLEMPTYSKKLLELAKKQRMNTDTRRNIFCILMSAEDYLDAFEKLLHLGLKNQQEREIIHVILHCCLQEKNFNPYYAIMAQKFCEYDRKFQMTIRCSIWDKLKALTDCSGSQLSNMAKLLAHLFLQQGLPISTLKIIEFGELDKITLRFMRQVLLSVLLHEDVEACLTVFSRVATSPKLKMFRDSLRLFIHHFLLKNLKDGVIEETQKELLTSRAKLVEKALVSTEYKNQFD